MRAAMRKGTVGVLAIAGAGWALGAAPPALAAPTDLRGSSLDQPLSALTVLGGSAASFDVANPSAVRARSVVVRVVLSKDRVASRLDVVVGRGTLAGLGAHARRTFHVTLAVPGSTKPGFYWLVACATAGRQAQASRANDCAVATAKVRVGRTAPAVVPTVTADAASGVSKVLDAAGGTVTATAAGGGTFTLTVPAKALAGPTTIRVVPGVAVAPGPPGVLPMAAAIVEPEGLLVPGATLTVAPPAGLPAKSLAAFVFGGEDEAIVRAPRRRGAGIVLDATVLGGFGVGIVVPRAPAVPLERRACLGASRDAACDAVSLRKRADAIVAAVDPRDDAGLRTATEALLAFERDTVLPALRAAARAGASADDLAPTIALALSIERQAQLLGIESGVDVIAEVADALADAGQREIARCAGGEQGPLRTMTDVLRVARSITLLGSSRGDALVSALEGDCLAKPYLLTFSMTTAESRATTPSPPGLVSGTGTIVRLAVPVPRLGQPSEAATGPMTFSPVTCDLGAGAFVIACVVTSATGSLEAKVLRAETTFKDAVRCGRTVKVPDYRVVFQLRVPSEEQQEAITFEIPPGPPFTQPLPTSGTFDRALSVLTEGELQQVTLPDAGGSVELSGATLDFHGSGVVVNAKGSALLELR